MNAKTILITTNLITIVITAFSVLYALHNKEQHPRLGWINQFLETATSPHQFSTTTTRSRSLQEKEEEEEPCCDCSTGAVVDRKPALFCFPSDCTVLVLGKDKPQRLETVTVGDYVLVGDGTYEPIYSMAHLAPNLWSQDYIHIETTDPKDQILVLSRTHMVVLVVIDPNQESHPRHQFIPAFQVQPGDQLYDAVRRSSVIIRKVTSNHWERGAIAPFTPSGTIVVNGFVTSSYVQLNGIPQWALPYSQWLAHTAAFPQRLLCYRIPHLCPQETYTKEGISKWVDGPLRVSQYLLDDAPIWIRQIGFLLVVMFLMILNVLEYVVFDYSPLKFCIILSCAMMYYYLGCPNRKTKINQIH
jgi:Hint module